MFFNFNCKNVNSFALLISYLYKFTATDFLQSIQRRSEFNLNHKTKIISFVNSNVVYALDIRQLGTIALKVTPSDVYVTTSSRTL